MKEVFTMLFLLGMASLPAYCEAQETVTIGKIQYSGSEDGSFMIVKGSDADISEAVIMGEVNNLPVRTIGEAAFKGRNSLQSVTIPGSVTKIEATSFRDCTMLTSVVFQPGEEDLVFAHWVFYGCTSLEEITLPSRLAQITGNSNFNGCRSLAKVAFEKGNTRLTDLKEYTFANTSITELDLSGLEKLVKMPANNFSSSSVPMCVILSPSTTLDYPNSLPQKTFANVNVVEMTYPEGTTTVTRNALNGYTKVRKVNLPSTLTAIEAKAFMNCAGIDLLTIPEGVTSIGELAFGYELTKSGLKNVILLQRGGTWPAALDKNNNAYSLIGAATKAYCYGDILDISPAWVRVPVIRNTAYSTYYAPVAVNMPAGAEGAVVTGISDGRVTLDRMYGDGVTVPALTPLLIKTAGSSPLYPEVILENSESAPSVNYLKGTLDDTDISGEEAFYTLTEDGGTFSFTRASGAFTNPANHAYLALPPSMADGRESLAIDIDMTVDEIASGEGEDSPVYNMMGVRMDGRTLPAGIYIKDGKKFIIR